MTQSGVLELGPKGSRGSRAGRWGEQQEEEEDKESVLGTRPPSALPPTWAPSKSPWAPPHGDAALGLPG